MRLLIAGLMIIFAWAPAEAQPNGSEAKAKAEIAAAREAFWAAHEKGDATALADLLTEDARLLAPGMEEIRGRAAIQAGATQMFEALAVEGFAIESSEISVHGDSAYEIATYTENLRPRGGQATPARGRYLIVWKRVAAGQWKVHRNMYHFISGGH